MPRPRPREERSERSDARRRVAPPAAAGQTRFAPSPSPASELYPDSPSRGPSPYSQPSIQYPPGSGTPGSTPGLYVNSQYTDSGDLGYYIGNPGGKGMGGVVLDGQHTPWIGGDEDEESRPLTGG